MGLQDAVSEVGLQDAVSEGLQGAVSLLEAGLWG